MVMRNRDPRGRNREDTRRGEDRTRERGRMERARIETRPGERSRGREQEIQEHGGHEQHREPHREQPRASTGLVTREPHTHALASPFAFMRRFSEEMDRLFEDFGLGRIGGLGEFSPSGYMELGRAAWAPQIEVFEREGNLVVRADLPGMDRDHVQVEVDQGDLILRGERHSEFESDEKEGYYRSERSYGSFYRRIPLPEGADPKQAQATFKDGVLEVTMPAPRHESQSRKIDIR